MLRITFLHEIYLQLCFKPSRVHQNCQVAIGRVKTAMDSKRSIHLFYDVGLAKSRTL